MISLLVIVPFACGLAALFSSTAVARLILRGTAIAHLALVAALCVLRPAPGAWLELDAAGLLFLAVTSILFCSAAFYVCAYLDISANRREAHILAPVFGTEPQPVFIAFLLFFLASMTLACSARHLGLLWVALEATTLATVPLICFHRTPGSLEAAWKYLMLCSVGIALALLGTFFLAEAAGKVGLPMLFDTLRDGAQKLDPLWLKAAFAAAFVGYGTKMGLAPMHTWLPDAHSESPAAVSALLSGALLNCAFLALLRVHAVCCAAGLAVFCAHAFLVFGFISVGVAAALMLRRRDYKRLLAYSSVENMGLAALGVGAGAPYAALLQALNHSFTKAALFMLSGNMLRRYKSRNFSDIKGLPSVLPKTAFLWAAGITALVGLPPFGIFFSKLLLLKALLASGHFYVCALVLFALAVVFAAVSSPVMEMLRPAQEETGPAVERRSFILPPLILLCFVLLLGVCIPNALDALLKSAALAVGGQ
jgi:hydrogenase-4 component F